MTAPKHFPPVEFLRECFDYDPETGLFRWRRRPEHHFSNSQSWKTWNTCHAGTPAFSSTDVGGYPVSRMTFQGKKFHMFASRVAWALMTGEHPKFRVDHRDCDRTNTEFANLREAENWQNGGNRRPRDGKLKGAFRVAGCDRYLATITVRGVRIELGRFDTEEQAHAAYVTAAKKHFGEFARAA